MEIKAKCRQCGKEFIRIRNSSRFYKYCSHKCSYAANKDKFKNNKYAERANGILTKTVWQDGYVHVYMPEHPAHNSSGCVFEHRLVMEKHLGRHLAKAEIIHHINGKRDDNRLENLRFIKGGDKHLTKYYLQEEIEDLQIETKKLRQEVKELQNQLKLEKCKNASMVA